MKYLFSFELTEPNYFNWYCTKGWYLIILYVISIRWSGFKRQNSKHPYASKAILYLNLFGLKLSFRIGLQNITWWHIRNEELYNLRCRFHNWYY